MKNHSWLNALENLSLISLGAGSVASILFKQMLYTTTPLSLLVVLGLFQRRRLTQVSEQKNTALVKADQHLARQVERLQQKVGSLPAPETITKLHRSLLFKDQEVSEKLHSEITNLKQGFHQRLAAVEQQGLGAMRQEMRQLVDRCNYLAKLVGRMGADLGELSDQIKANDIQTTIEHLKLDVATLQTNLDSFTYQTKPNLAVLQEHITRIDRQFSKLPPPVDVSSLKQEVAELVRIIADLVPRRDFSSLISEMKALHQEQEALRQSIVAIETAALNFKRSFNEPLNDRGQGQNSLPRTNASVNLIEPFTDLSTLGSVAAGIYPELQELAVNHLENLRSQLQTVQEFTDGLARQQKQLRDQLNQLPQTLDVVALHRQFTELSLRVPVSEGTSEAFKARIQELLHQELQSINQQAMSAVPHSELIFDFPATANFANGVANSRAVLEQALESTQKRLILILPWSEQCELDEALFRKFETFLSQQRQLDLGWCDVGDRDEERWLSRMQRGWMTDMSARSLLQDTLHKLLQLKRLYPNQFQFKILGTSENFLVSDQSFAVLGIANAFKTTTPFPELQLKLKTTETSVIHRLIQRFDQPILAAEDLTSYWNRAVTRYDLGDKAGAIEDYTHVLSINPTDAVTYNHRGLAYYDLENLDNAIADFNESIRLNPQQTAAYCNRGFICSEQGSHWEALNDYSTAIQIDSNCPLAYFYRGMTQQKLENHSAAIADYSEAIRLAPDSPVAYYYRGLAWQKLENLPEAIADFELSAQFFWVRGSKTNAQKALKNIAKLRQEMDQAEVEECGV